MKLKSWIFGLTFIAASLGVCAAARANQTICVDNAVGANLFNSLQQWANTGTGTTTIKVAAGTYNISVVLVQFSSGSLNLFGGYAPGTSCDEAQRDLAAYTTILEGGGSGVFYVEPVAALTIDGFTLRNYTGSNALYSVQGVTIETVTSAANLAVTRFVAQGDSTVNFHNGGGDSNGSIVVENCLVFGQPNNTAAGTAALHIATWGNNACVVNCTVADNHISGLELETQNTASAFVYNSVAYSNGEAILIDSITGAASHIVAGNLIGVAPDGMGASGNGTGIRIDNAQGNVLENNLIGNNTVAGIIINGPSAHANVVRGNIIGETPNNAQAAGNMGPGVLIENGSYNNRIGALPGDYNGANVINFNGTQGVFVSNGGAGNLLLANTLGFNTGLAIDLGAAGPTPNQNPQVSSPSQPNELQNFPVISNAFRTQATEWVQGSVTTFANQTVQIDDDFEG